MAIITRDPIVKGTPAAFTLDKSELALVPEVANNPRFSNPSTWKTVSIGFRSEPGNQNRTVLFNASEASPVGYFKLSTTAFDVFRITSITIKDFDNGELEILRSEFAANNLSLETFDIDFTATAILLENSEVAFLEDGDFLEMELIN